MDVGTLVNFASDAAFAISGASRIVAWNERAADLLGYSSAEALDRPCDKILQIMLPGGKLLCGPGCEAKRCFEHQSPFAASECCLRHKDGRWLHADISTLVTPARGNGSAAARTVAIVLMRPHEQAVFARADGRLQILTFGRFGLSANGRALSVDRWYRRQALTLLKILITYRREVLHREHLIAHLWPDADERRGRERLKVTAYVLRERLRAAGMSGDIVSAAGSAYALDREAIWLDCEAFEKSYEEGRRLAQRGRASDALVRFEEAARLYQGDFLPEDIYADWCAEERERLRESYFDVLGHVIDGYLDRGDFEEAAVICRRGLV
ncbi:MAG TPA: BTAD domain-containing putative transcriptional regulator, partial [Xanthobacteraceae bacterium]